VLKTYVREMLEAYEQDPAAKLKAPSIPNKLLKVAIKVCSKRTRELDELIDDPNGFENLVSDAEWKILGADEMTEEDLLAKKHSDWIKKNDIKHNKKRPKRSAKPSSRAKEEGKESDDEFEEDDGEVQDQEDEEQKQNDAAIAKISEDYPLFKQASDLLKILKEKYPHFGIDGERNIWICKPAGSSRGRGIVLYRNLV
jgi:Tubulin-tyrosine ligase family